MKFFLPFLILFSLVFSGCEDKKYNPQNSVIDDNLDLQKTKKQTSALQEEENEVQTPQRMIDTINGQLLSQEELIPFLTKYANDHPENKIRISTRFGNIDVLLFNHTPLHRANFILLAKNDYFDGTYFHRVDQGFVIQGGNSDNPSTNRKRYKFGSYLIPSEASSKYPHKRGSFSAAKYSEQNVSNASSPFEFFIVQSKNGAPHLDGEHTVYGKVISGMDVVDEIAKQETDQGEWPLRNIEMKVEILD